MIEIRLLQLKRNFGWHYFESPEVLGLNICRSECDWKWRWAFVIASPSQIRHVCVCTSLLLHWQFFFFLVIELWNCFSDLQSLSFQLVIYWISKNPFSGWLLDLSFALNVWSLDKRPCIQICSEMDVVAQKFISHIA